jgi:choline dehydrogenase-like flavoprotein
MIDDLGELPRGTRIAADICLIGGGAAGITIARELAGGSARVCLVDGGGLGYEEDSQALYDGACVGAPVALQGGRLRFLGGSTNHWGGRCAPMDEIDFRRRDWVPHSGWPMDRTELDPFYARAQRVAGFSAPWRQDPQTLSYLKTELPAIDERWLKPFLWRYAPSNKDTGVWNWGLAYRQLLQESRNVRVLLHANFASFVTHAGERKRIRGVTVRSLNGTAATITADKFVLCCGGLENARLLLLAAGQNGGGFGTEHDAVGRYFAQHSCGVGGVVASTELMSTLQEQFNILTGADGLEVEVGLALAPQVQEERGVLNCSAFLEYQGDPDSGVAAAQDIWRSLLKGGWPPDVAQKAERIGADLPAVLRGVARRLSAGHTLELERSAGIPSRSALVRLWLEQAPNPQSRISLADELDALGLRRVKVDWRLGESERRSAAAITTLIGAEFARLGIGRCRLEPWLQGEGVPLDQVLTESYHYIGATRMSDDPSAGVVDRDCAVHGMRNLYVAGSSVFPTTGHANPTFTIIALALRLADHLR